MWTDRRGGASDHADHTSEDKFRELFRPSVAETLDKEQYAETLDTQYETTGGRLANSFTLRWDKEQLQHSWSSPYRQTVTTLYNYNLQLYTTDSGHHYHLQLQTECCPVKPAGSVLSRHCGPD